MENINPTLELVLFLKRSIECGESINQAIKSFVQHNHSDVAKKLATWHLKLSYEGLSGGVSIPKDLNPYQIAIYNLILRGLRGEAVYSHLCQVEAEVIESLDAEIEEYIAILPIKMLVPLLLFQFPALLILLFGPMLNAFIKSLSGM